ncbi:hypothetical protein NPX13_g8379 [Xylaria arbuscula]|uniref:PARP-type domain-containing protein n=1 Tax=Xylaria arbuscula TaxID=114810 RepID=A0A9W8N8Q0_9PEZI|nr:hypothetical protein NPX13_g8379 [Xylaria arbuscula]
MLKKRIMMDGGDFEVAPNTAPSPNPPQVASASSSTRATIKQPTPAPPTADVRPQRARVLRASTLDLVSNNLVSFNETPAQPSSQTKFVEHKPAKKAVNADPNVLFDADDFDGDENVTGSDNDDDDDDFGEFETVAPPVESSLDVVPTMHSSSINTVHKASELLLDLDLNGPTHEPAQTTQVNFNNASAQSRTQELDKVKSFGKPVQPQKTRPQAQPRAFEDDWDSFPDLPNQPNKSPPKETLESSWDWDSVEAPVVTKSTIKSEVSTKKSPPQPMDANTTNDDASWDWDPVDTKTEALTEIEDGALPPVNIPPPSILLSAFPQLFEQANEYLYKPVSGQSQSIKERVLSDPKVYDFLRGFLILAVVAARVIAGRKLSRKQGHEAGGSEQDADDTGRSRGSRCGQQLEEPGCRLRSAVASANSARKGNGALLLKIPEISETIPVQTAKDVPTAPKACVICGLKRNERLPKVDHEVEDSFGEWWVEHWGHVDCKRFWLQHENTLRQR